MWSSPLAGASPTSASSRLALKELARKENAKMNLENIGLNTLKAATAVMAYGNDKGFVLCL